MIKVICDESCLNYSQQGHPERPQRISETLLKLRAQKEPTLDWDIPATVTDSILLRAHTKGHLQRLSQPLDFDADTAAYPGIADHARKSVGAALQALACIQKGEMVFSLMRPPGHHAESDRAMGFCYLNQAAITVLEAQQRGFSKVAVYDFDVHHGNGTEEILLNRPNCEFFSIHQHPCYPGTGDQSRANCHNFPIPPKTPRMMYREILQKALDQMTAWKPDLIVVSAGFDAYAKDPLAEGTLEPEDYHWLGKSLTQTGIPFLSILEGGYSNDLPELIFQYLKGMK